MSKAPPLGVMPLYIWQRRVLRDSSGERAKHLIEAIRRYHDARRRAPKGWFAELGVILRELEEEQELFPPLPEE